MDNQAEIHIKICMGSSCFARGNDENLKYIEAFIEKHALNAKIDLYGSRCENKCENGPNIVINGKYYSQINLDDLKNMLKEMLMEKV